MVVSISVFMVFPFSFVIVWVNYTVFFEKCQALFSFFLLLVCQQKRNNGRMFRQNQGAVQAKPGRAPRGRK